MEDQRILLGPARTWNRFSQLVLKKTLSLERSHGYRLRITMLTEENKNDR